MAETKKINDDRWQITDGHVRFSDPDGLTLKSLLEDPLIKDIAADAIKEWDLSKEEFYDWTLGEIAQKVGWGNPGRGLERLFEAALQGQYCYRLYSDDEIKKAPEKEHVSIVHFPSDDASAGDKPYIFLVPGGGFVNVWNLTEGWPVARIFNELGYNVFILTYQVGIEGAAVAAMDNMARAFEVIRSNRDRFHVDPDRYITCGFSAGGYVICLWNTEKGYRSFGIHKPAACFPIYPVTSYRIFDEEDWDEGEDKDEFARSGTGCCMKEACSSCFEIPTHVEGFPPTAIFVAAEDELISPDHSKNLAEALKQADIPCRLEIGPTGGHGFADGVGMCMEGWPERAVRWYEEKSITS
ncbi:MAG: alpha/beta hydrolase [Lachnospiraceae bacterium]|nr:alpha/beta hydrolase [Lachnospiraceae bacterium]